MNIKIITKHWNNNYCYNDKEVAYHNEKNNARMDMNKM